MSGPVCPAHACPACACHVAVPFLDAAPQPLATLGWPGSAEAAQDMERLTLDFVRCVDCGHVFNAAFDYARVPYRAGPNRMFNASRLWTGFLRRTRERILAGLPAEPTVVEIGHGDGGFLSGLAAARPAGRFVGFDPQGVDQARAAQRGAVQDGAGQDGSTVEFRSGLFDPRVHLEELRPDTIVARHVLEHLPSPLGFLQDLSFAAARLGMSPRVYLEVPCIDRALAAGRSVDFYYEHGSQFTSESFARMLSRCGLDVEEIGRGYDGEVVYGLARLGRDHAQLRRAAEAESFREAAADGEGGIRRQLAELHVSGARVAIWGGTGKSAAFMNRYGVDALRFPLVVESDPDKVGGFVPGTGQEIRFRDLLLEAPADVILIPPQWRARDILREIAAVGILFSKILIEHDNRLVDFVSDPHPYRSEPESKSVPKLEADVAA